MTRNPFSEPGDEPEDADRTVIRPMPSGRHPATAAIRPTAGAMQSQPAFPPPVPTPPTPTRDVPVPATTPIETAATADTPPGSPLAVAAAPLLQLLARLHNIARQADPTGLHTRAVQALREFEVRARNSGVPMEQLRPAHYALCASLDDVVLNTPWGATSAWAQHQLVAVFHPDRRSDSNFFDVLERLQRDPATFMPAIEIMYLCLSLGFMGRYRQSPQGVGELNQLRAATGTLIAGRYKAAAAELSPRWQGITAPYQPSRARLPIWVVHTAALAFCGAMLIWVSTALNAASDAQTASMRAAPPEHMPRITRAVAVQPPPPGPHAPSILDRLQDILRLEINSGVVSVLGTPATPIIRVSNRGGFAPGAATPPPALVAVLARIGSALNSEPGSVQVIDYTDNQPIRTVKFPSNFQLSSARAEAARAAIARTLSDGARISAEGRADEDPITSNATAEGREQNRRIEVVLHSQE